MKFITNEPALLIGSTLVVSDLHIGIEYDYRKRGIKMPSQTHHMLSRLKKLLKRTHAKKLLVCGDLKHKVPGLTVQEEREVPDFVSTLAERVTIDIVQGNHDADLAQLLPPGIRLHPTEGFLQKDVYFSHGHTWPSPSLLQAKRLVIGHIQPQIEIKDSLGYIWREQVWVRAPLNPEKVKEKYSRSTDVELIILPSFNPLAGGLALNKEQARESPILKLAHLKEANIYLLDGTFLGRLSDL